MANATNLTLMAVHAHPDDESSSTGGVLARYSDEGITTIVVTCTNGEYGDGPDHVKPDGAGHEPHQVAKTRLGELDVACGHLAVTHLETLGYHDSGMADWPYKAEGHVFAQVPLQEPLDRLVALVEQYRPDVMVTYDTPSDRTHPDHAQAHRIAVEAFRQTGIPSKLYFIVRRPRDWEKLRARMEAAGLEVPNTPQRTPDAEAQQRMEEAGKRITTTVNTTSAAERKRAALVAHASQLDRSWWSHIPDDALSEVLGQETFVRVEDRTGAPLPEDDLFAGLR